MAFLTAGQISRLAVAILSRRLVLPMTVSRVPGEEFRGDNGDTVTIRVPEARTAQIQSTPGDSITPQAINEDSADVTVVQLFDAASITDHDLSLGIRDFGRQVLRPQADAVARGCEDQLADTINDLAADASFAASADEQDTKDQILFARETLTDADVPPDGRFFGVSPQIATRVIAHPDFSRVNTSGSTRTLRRGEIGELYGFRFVESNGFTGGEAAAYHESAFGFATFPTEDQEAVESSVVTEQGLSIRWLRQWNPSRLQQESVLTAFAGAGVVDLDRVVKFDTSV
ncbi:MAG: P22 phage major capsid protein family protein [Gemmatimonadota bacterium]